ncbi:MAG: PDZ domain-containing protein, partial [Gemmataceae bacterium]
EAAAVVQGVVRQVFRSERQNRTDYIVMVEVARSEGRLQPAGKRVVFPGPGDMVYVHVYRFPELEEGREKGASVIPEERQQIKAYLMPREHGGWESIHPDWYEVTSDRPVVASPADPAPKAPEVAKERASLSTIGVNAETLKVKDRYAYRVKSVERGSPAQKVGIEVGDILVGAKNQPFTRLEQLEELLQTGEALPLMVVDGKSGRVAQVELPATRKVAEARPDETKTPVPPPASKPKPLGISAETVKVGERTALEVTRVDPDGAAAKAGVETGDLIVAANGSPVTGPEQLSNALRKSDGELLLTIRDGRTGRDAQVKIVLAEGRPSKPPVTADLPREVGPGKGKLGLVTELTFYDVEAAVKITEVEEGSAADRAGLKPGLVLLEANGKLLLHPDDLAEAVRASNGTLKLTVVNPSTKRKGTVDINLGGRD